MSSFIAILHEMINVQIQHTRLDFHMHIALLQQSSNKHRPQVNGAQLMEKVSLVHACLIAENFAIKS